MKAAVLRRNLIVGVILFVGVLPAVAFAGPRTGPLYVTLTLTAHGSRSAVYITGATNLPDRTLLMLDFAEKAYVDLPPSANSAGYYLAQAKLHVHGGRFRSPTLTYRGRLFPPGRYQVSVITPFTGIEPTTVQAVFGLHGRNLRGPLVKRDLGDNLVEPPPTWITIS
jgi:hypothetical protein